MSYFLEGVLLGLGLSVMVGPIFLALTQTSMERGAKAGLTVGLGIWVSDVLIIGACYYFVRQLTELEYDPRFKLWMGLAGGAVLVLFGLSAMLKRVTITDYGAITKARTWFGFWLKGFLVNTINPFTFFFWISLTGTTLIARGFTPDDKILLLSGVMCTIVVANSITVLLAKAIRTKLQIRHLQVFNQIAGAGLLLFGLILIARVLN